ncbi:MAG TPA: sugar phosphate isomerase/epimerase family protein [Gemmataceae bacterium]|jgi:sugar phosphate isomerase/epimerase|nr:sugar phosphate isomerase/epimerase family protein [Gemmataceae bacterium]
MNRFKLGVVLETTGLPLRRALQEASRLGVHGVQVDVVGDLAPDRLTDTGRREFRNLLKTYNLELSALNCPLRRGLDVAENLQPRIEHVRKVMQLAFELGPRRVIVPLPKVPEDAASPRALTAREALTALGSFGDRAGTVLALEAGLDSGDQVRDYLNSFDTGSLLVNFDPVNFLLNGFDPLASLAALAGKVSHTHARDARTATVGGGAREVPVGAGDIEWMMYVATLESIEYRGFLTVDREAGEDRYTDVAAGVRFLKRFVSQTP